MPNPCPHYLSPPQSPTPALGPSHQCMQAPICTVALRSDLLAGPSATGVRYFHSYCDPVLAEALHRQSLYWPPSNVLPQLPPAFPEASKEVPLCCMPDTRKTAAEGPSANTPYTIPLNTPCPLTQVLSREVICSLGQVCTSTTTVIRHCLNQQRRPQGKIWVQWLQHMVALWWPHLHQRWACLGGGGDVWTDTCHDCLREEQSLLVYLLVARWPRNWTPLPTVHLHCRA